MIRKARFDKVIILLIAFIFIFHSGQSQNVPAAFSKKDSVFFSKPYPFILPILGDKAHKKNIKLPYRVGITHSAHNGRSTTALESVAKIDLEDKKGIDW